MSTRSWLAIVAFGLIVGSHQSASAVDLLGGNGSRPPANAATNEAAAQAAAAAKRSIDMLGRASQAIQNMRAGQDAARALAKQGVSLVPNGMVRGAAGQPNGLLVAPGADDPTSGLWQGADLPTEMRDGESANVTVKQNQQKAILTWESFNVGRETTLYFDQRAGGADAGSWIALNRVLDPGTAPSQILGSIKAEGQVYVINRNGIVFGGASQVNVGTLLASSLDIKGPNTNLIADRNQAFLSGLFASGTAIFQSRKLPDATGALVIPDAIEGDVVVEAGAILRTAAASGLNDGGRLMLFGPNVHNAGSILTADGQAVLAAGRTVTVSIGTDKQLQFAAGPAVPFADLYYSNPNYVGEPAYNALNTGLITAERGAILMAGTLTRQAGVLTATTGINRPGAIKLVADGRLTLAEGSAILMDADAADVTAPAFNGGLSVSLTGSSVDIQTNTLIRAPSGSVTIETTNLAAINTTHSNVPDDNGRAFLAPGSIIDVSGLTDVVVPVGRAIIKIQPRGQEFANSPLQRNGALRGLDLYIDTRKSGVREDGVAWIGSPLLDASGYVGLIQKSTREYLVGGGSVTINGQKDIVVPQGATVDVSGGYVTYAGGMVYTSQLLGADGRVYDIADADPMLRYVGVAGAWNRQHSRWGVTQIFNNPLIDLRHYEPTDFEGAAAGKLSIIQAQSNTWGGAVYFDGNMIADTVNGARQIADSQPAARGKLAITSQGSLLVSADGQRLPDGIGIDSVLPTADLSLSGSGFGLWSWLSADKLSDIGLGSLSLTTPGGLLVTDDATLSVVPGGSITLSGTVIRMDGTLEARSGSIELRTLQHVNTQIILPSDVAPLLEGLPGGVLTANTPAPMDVVVTQDVVLAAGTAAPYTISVNLTNWPAGVPTIFNAGIEFQFPVTLAADWVVNPGASQAGNPIFDVNTGLQYRSGQVVPRGTTIYGGYFLAGEVIPADAFPNGINFSPVATTFNAGAILPVPVTLAKGTRIAPGLSLPFDVRVDPYHGLIAGNIALNAGASIDTRGLWVDDRAAPSAYGARFINGGSITIATDASQFARSDNTGSIRLAAGSSIDASSGGHILRNGTWASKNGVPLGKGGDISILTYAGVMFGPSGGAPSVPTTPAMRADVQIDGTLSSFGFTSGGKLSLRAQTFGIGETPDAYGRVILDRDFFHDNSFGSYSLSSVYETVIADGTADVPAIIAPRQVNYVPTNRNFAPGADPLAEGAVGIGLLSDYRRQATNLSISANTFFATTRGTTSVPIFDGVQELRFGANTKILADAGATVSLSTGGKLLFGGEIRAHGGTIEILGSATARYRNSTQFYQPNASVWLLPGSVLDASGTILLDDLAPRALGSDEPLRLGRVLDGGTVTVSNARGYVLGMEGSRIDVSGVAGELDVLRSSSDVLSGWTSPTGVSLPPVNPYTRQAVWSDGGTINLGASEAFYFDGTLNAEGGAPEARGGTLNYTFIRNPRSSAATALITATLTAAPFATVPGSVSVGADLPFATYGGRALIRTDIIERSGADSLTVTNTASGNTLNIEDGVSLTMPESIRLSTSYFNVVAARVAPGQTPSTQAPVASLSAPYISLLGIGSGNPTTNSVRGALSFTADTIDIDGSLIFNNLQTLNLNATGDIRLFGRALNANFTLGPNANVQYTKYDGSLTTPGDITLTAAQVYPGTGQNFIIRGSGANSTIRFVQNGARPGVPFSAGGTLQITAPTIIQGGTIRAPQGSITFGVAGTTQSVEFLPGSLTSVSLEGAIIPYGTTQDELNWIFSRLDLAAPPDKLIAVNSNSVNMAPGAVLDLSAGGDLIGPEFVPGTGGSRDVLQLPVRDANGAIVPKSPLYPDNRTIYAILPGYSGTQAPVDKTVLGAMNAGDVYLTGVPGLPDGYYTLLPASYALLPGAYRVVARPGGDPRAGGVLPDGTAIAAGFYASSDHARRDSAVTMFEVQSRDVWRQYSEYRLTSANAFFGNLEVLHADVAPYRPQDAGRLAISATNQLVLQAQTLFKRVEGGRGGRVDIGARDLQVLGDGDVARSGYLGLFASDLTKLGAESVLLGGTRIADATGQTITAVANSILVSNDTDSALKAPELLFAIKTDPSGADPNAGNGLVFESGSVVIGEGVPVQNAPLKTVGDGALVRVSGGTLTSITNTSAPAISIARVVIASGATLVGKGSIALQSVGNVNLQTGAILTTDNIDVLTRSISLVGEGATVPTSGFVLDAAALATLGNVRNITLTSATTIDSYGNLDIRLARGSGQSTSLTFNASGIVGHGGDLTLEAARIAFTNTTATTPGAAVTGGGDLTITADELAFGAGAKQITGFSRLDATAGVRVIGQGKGSIDFGSMPVTMTTPLITTAAAADQELRTTGAISLLGGGATEPVSDGLGGRLSLAGSAVTIDTAIVMRSGGMTLAATTGDISLGANARLIATGYSKQIFDKVIYTGGGAISLLAANGNITSASGAVLDVSASPLGGDAGAISLQAKGSVGLPGTMGGTASAGFEGGRFALLTGGSVNLDALSSVLMGGGFHGGVDVRTGQGDLSLTAILTASSVALSADGGLVTVSGLIDASGKKGGRIDLYGRDGVTLASGGHLAATGSDPEKRGGDIFIGTVGTGFITLASGSSIDVSGGTLAGLSGGTVNVRAPIINSDVNVAINSSISGARSVVLEAYKVFDTTSSNFDGVIDPLGLYDSAGNRLASGVDQAHLDFYTSELVSFVQNTGVDFGRFSGVSNFRGRAGIELSNSDANRNNGDILLVSDWDLGAGSINAATGMPNLTWRTGVEPGVLTLRASGNVDVRANLTDGFFNTSSTPVPHAADLMPASWGDSWSYRIVGGADLASVNPKALRPLTAFVGNSSLPTANHGDVLISGHRTLVVGSTTYELPNMIRTGTGSIEIAAGRDVALRDTVAPGVIYTAGRPSADLPAANFTTVNGQLVPSNPQGFNKPLKPTINGGDWSCTLPGCGVSYVVTTPVWPEAAGDISILAQRDVIGLQNVIDTTGAQSGRAGSFIGQIWTPWLIRTGLVQPLQEFGVFNPMGYVSYAGAECCDLGVPHQTASWINFGSFNQGVMSVGGDVEIIAGRDVNQFSVSLPTTVRVSGAISALDPTPVVHVTGGGDLLVRSGRDIVSGAYYVGKGEGTLSAGGSIRAGFNITVPGVPTPMPVATMLGVADSTFTLTAGGALDLGGVFSPTYLPVPWFWSTDGKSFISDFYQYSRDSGVRLTAVGGDVTVKSFQSYQNTALFVSLAAGSPRQEHIQFYQGGFSDLGSVWPASLIAHAASGAINVMNGTQSIPMELYPSPTGQLELIAEGDVKLASTVESGLWLTDKNPYLVPSAVAPKLDGLNVVTWRNGNLSVVIDYNVGFDPGFVPDYDFHLTHIEDPDPVLIYSHTGDINDVGGRVPLRLAKSARVRAGRDLVDLPVWAQNLRDDDLTSVIAGRDMYATVLGRFNAERSAGTSVPTGTMSVNVGGPGTIYVEAGRNIGPLMSPNSKLPGGIVATGPANNRFLPREGANVYVVFGVANGKNTDGMITAYLDPANAAEVPYSYSSELTGYLNGLRKRRGEAEIDFTPAEAVAAFRALPEIEQTAFLYDVLFAELQAAADPINHPDNYQKYDRSYAAIQTLFPPGLGYPDTDGKATKKNSGSLDLRSASIQTQFGGKISIVAPVGRIIVGSQSATALSNDPAKTGILTLRGGDIRIFADSHVLVNQSRIFTEQGGDVLMWSSNGDLNAGKGAKTSASYPPLLRTTNNDGYSSIDPAGLVTGAGVGALQTIVGQRQNTVYLIAPHGTVDLGDAGVRSTGDLNIAALQVLNADNLQVGGTTTGIPMVKAPDTGGLTQAADTAGAAVREAAAAPAQSATEQPSIIIVEVIGYGGGDPAPEQDQHRKKPEQQSYNPNAPVRILGHGALTEPQLQALTPEEQARKREVEGRL
ncbi:filamentous haemagglutinin family protein [Hyphomicrobium album]|uniref:filamentous haemagglutinin family protein n=1 Tax=Hyphomicrobium album TaxID=2665159 RepID=UPI0018ABA25C|nr:filamentous haemagglutinin family protein [Hyphomicrobium album]